MSLLDKSSIKKNILGWAGIPIAKFLNRLGMQPNGITLVGLLIALLSAGLASQGSFIAAGIVLMIAGVFDFLDGALARFLDRTSIRGALWDSIADRISESALFMGLLWFYLNEQVTTPIVLIFLAWSTSFLVSYIRARAEGLGIPASTGWVARPERVVVLAIGLMTSFIQLALILIATLSLLTILQRLAAFRNHTGSDRKSLS